MYEDMRKKVENVVDKGEVSEEYVSDDEQHQAFNKWTKSFSRMDHPTDIQAILDKSKDRYFRPINAKSHLCLSREK